MDAIDLLPPLGQTFEQVLHFCRGSGWLEESYDKVGYPHEQLIYRILVYKCQLGV